MTDPVAVRAQYATEDNLEVRRSVWQRAVGEPDPIEVAIEEIRAALPVGRSMPDVLEVGSGTGAFAERLRAEVPAMALLATDQSGRFVELIGERGIPAQLMDVQTLLMGDASYDVVIAMWMLYHVPDLERGLAEIRRVLRPGGTLVAVTNGDEHVADLRREAGGDALRTAFSSENGAGSLRRHFGEVRRQDLCPRAVLPDHAAAVAYLESSGEDVAWDLPAFDGPREYAGHVTVFTCR